MKKKKFVGIAAAAILILFSVTAAFSQQRPVRDTRRPADMGQKLLDLTPEQTEALAALRSEHQKDRTALMDRIRLLSLENRQLMRDPEANVAKIKDLRRQIFDLREKLFDQGLAHRNARNALLTPEQLEKVKKLESRMDRNRRSGRRSAASLKRGARGRSLRFDRMRSSRNPRWDSDTRLNRFRRDPIL